MSRSVPSFPPAGDPEARYDAVLRRGAQLRRRHHLRVAAGAGGTMAAVVLALVLFMGGSDGSQPEEFLGTTTTTTTTTSPTELSVEVGAGGGAGTRAVVVTVRDPQQPAGPGSQVCVHLQVSTPGGTAGGVAAGSSCWATGAPDGPPAELAPSDAVVGCAAVTSREPYPTPDGTQARRAHVHLHRPGARGARRALLRGGHGGVRRGRRVPAVLGRGERAHHDRSRGTLQFRLARSSPRPGATPTLDGFEVRTT